MTEGNLVRPAAMPSSTDGAAVGASPLWALFATLAMQTLATMAAYSLPAIAPAVGRDTGVDAALVGYFISTVYGVGIVSAVLSPSFIHRFGAVRIAQSVLLSVLAMLAMTAVGGLASFACGAVFLGLAYGATAPASTHLLVPRTPAAQLNLLLSIRQIGVPLGGVLGALILPPIVVAAGWRPALLVQIVPSLLLLLLLELPRRRWDADRNPRHPLSLSNALRPLHLLRDSRPLRRLSIACFVYSGVQLCFISFTTVHLTSVAGLDLVRAGQALAVYQAAGVITRPIWGWLADRFVAARWLLVLQGFVMAAASVFAGGFDQSWLMPQIFTVCAVAGATAAGFTGIAYAEYARLGKTRRTEATGLGASAMFSGVMVLPSGFGFIVGLLHGYGPAYSLLALLATLSAVMLALPATGWRET
jgi:MFS family permease